MSCICVLYFFFFKQKTAYEMRISDWSSDVCSSDLPQQLPRLKDPRMDRLDALEAQSVYILREAYARIEPLAMLWSLGKDSNVMIWLARKAFFGHVPRSEEHTSELQSLMRISYAVFCLKTTINHIIKQLATRSRE